MNVISFKEFNQRMETLDKEAEAAVGEGVIPTDAIFEVALREQLLLAFKAGIEFSRDRILACVGTSVGRDCSCKRCEQTTYLAKHVLQPRLDTLKELP